MCTHRIKYLIKKFKDFISKLYERFNKLLITFVFLFHQSLLLNCYIVLNSLSKAVFGYCKHDTEYIK